MKKQPELTAQTKQNLKDAFWQLYTKKNIYKITIREITLVAGYNRGTFYEYFTDVYDVLDQIETELLPKVEQFPYIDSSTASSPDLFEDFIKFYEENRKYYKVLLGDNGDPSFLSKMKNSVKPKLKQIWRAKGIPDDFELDYTLEFTLSAMIGILCYWYQQEDIPPTDKLLLLIKDIMNDGITNKLSKL